jgi:uncharacterized protein (DUF2147 family)
MKTTNHKNFSKTLFLGLLLVLFTQFDTLAQNGVVGKWKSIDDESNKPKSIVEISEKNGKIYGKIIKLYRGKSEDPDPICDKCAEDDDRFKKKIIGMEIIKGLSKDDNEFSGGTILDPEDGRVYRCKIWLSGSDLMVRGYWGPFYRTQTWKREN